MWNPEQEDKVFVRQVSTPKSAAKTIDRPSYQEREEEDKALELYLDPLSKKGTRSQLDRLLKIGEKLGTGEYADVYLATPLFPKWRNKRVAIKEIQIADPDTGSNKSERLIRQMMREMFVACIFNELKRKRICPGFLSVYAAFTSLLKNVEECRPRHHKNRIPDTEPNYVLITMVMQKADGTFYDWLRVPHTTEEYMSCAFQNMISCITASRLFDIVNNDLYPRNILVLETPPDEVFCYSFGGRDFYVKTGGFQFVLADFGLCTSRQMLENRHQDMHYFFEGQMQPIEDFAEFDYSRHILSYTGVPAYCRDLLTFLRTFTATAGPASLHSPRRWVKVTLYRLQTLAAKGLLRDSDPVGSSQRLADFFVEVFSPEFLKNHGVRGDMFSMSAETSESSVTYFDPSKPIDPNVDVLPRIRSRYNFGQMSKENS